MEGVRPQAGVMEKNPKRVEEKVPKQEYTAPRVREYGALQRMTKGATYSQNDQTGPGGTHWR